MDGRASLPLPPPPPPSAVGRSAPPHGYPPAPYLPYPPTGTAPPLYPHAPYPHFYPGMYGGPPPPPYGPPSMAVQREAAMSLKVAIPTVCSGCVLGKGGSIIKELRAQSGTNISLADPDNSTPNERVVTITGTPSAIALAFTLIREAVEKYVPPAGGSYR